MNVITFDGNTLFYIYLRYVPFDSCHLLEINELAGIRRLRMQYHSRVFV